MPYCWPIRRLLLAVSVCAFAGLLGGLGYAALTPPPFTGSAMIVLRPGTPVPGLGSHVTRLTDTVVSVSAQGKTPAQARTAASAVVRSYLARVEGAKLLEPVAIPPRHRG
ncbi:MAG TPA: hypothetical protein VGQ26_29920, partial [Streptosporangiaceae bacterium]|nr:hypothetical protein [Streptosporangiaceae bacterium]